MWSSPDVIGLFLNNVVSFSRNVVLSGLSFSVNVVPKPRMLSVRADYVLSSLHLGFGTGDGFFEMPSELARDQEAHSAAQSFGFYTAESNFEAALRVFPKNVGFS